MKILTPFEAEQMLKAGIRLIDVRQPLQFSERFIKGALNIALGQNFKNLLKEFLLKDQAFILFGDEENTREAFEIAKTSGYKNLEGIFTGGIEAWEKEGRPIDMIITTDANELRIDAAYGKVTLLDIRPAEEFESSSVERSINIPLQKIWEEKELENEFNMVIYVFGNSDEEAMTAISYLKLEGYVNVYFVEGGFEAVKAQEIKFSDN